MDRYAVFGDSYVTRLSRYTNGRLNIDRPVRFFGVPGICTGREREEVLQCVLDYKPRFVFLNLGGSNFTSDSDLRVLAEDTMNIVRTLKDGGVERVFVASIVERGSFPAWTGLDHKRFRAMFRSVNKKLMKQLPREDFVNVDKRLRFPRHYDSDLIHPGDKEGGMIVFMYKVLDSFRKTLG